MELIIGTSKDIICFDANTRQNELSYLTIQQKLFDKRDKILEIYRLLSNAARVNNSEGDKKLNTS